jgi:hypothetical protein
MARRRAKPKPKTGPNLEQLFRGEIIGGILVVLAILLMLSLLSSNRGEVTGAVVTWLRDLFGAGVWISIDVTPYITGNGTYNLALTPLGSTAISFASRQAGANAPQLVIETSP